MEITAQIQSRIAAIQERIDDIAGGSAALAPTAPPVSNASSFASALAGASDVTDPNGEQVRPLSPGVQSFGDLISGAAVKYGVDPKLIQSVMQVESGGDPSAVSHAGAMGLMQLMPTNVAEAGVTNVFDPAQNIDAGARQLSGLMGQFGGNLDLALAAYNAGPNAVKRFGGIPPYPETQNYVRKVRALMDKP